MKSSRKPPRPYSRHGLNALKARVMVRGLQAIDGRSAPARALLAWRKELVGDLGGEEAISAQERAVVGLAVQTKLLLDSIDAWLLAQPTLVNARRRSLLPVVLQRQQLADGLARYMGQLGLKRRARPVPALADYLATRYGRRDDTNGPHRRDANTETARPTDEAAETHSEGMEATP